MGVAVYSPKQKIPSSETDLFKPAFHCFLITTESYSSMEKCHLKNE